MLKFTFHLLNVNFSNLIIVVWVQPLYIQCVHMYCKLVLCVCPLYTSHVCNDCPLYIPPTCNVCPLYIPLYVAVQVHQKPV